MLLQRLLSTAACRLLKERNGSSAMVRFEKALMLAKSVNERIYERRSMRGLAAAARLQVRASASHASHFADGHRGLHPISAAPAVSPEL